MKIPSRKRAKAQPFPITDVARILRREVRRFTTPIVTIYSEQRASPYLILISTLLSLRTQDKTTAEGSVRLFALARTPEAMVRLSPSKIEKAIYPVGFYRNKARTILDVSRRLLDEHGGEVPDSVDELVKFKGVGRKTANLVVTLGHGKPGICVDTHVHRITNRWGYVQTKTPDQTETVLREILPRRYWMVINDWLVTWGQNVCKPISPHCSTCPLDPHCPRHGVGISR